MIPVVLGAYVPLPHRASTSRPTHYIPGHMDFLRRPIFLVRSQPGRLDGMRLMYSRQSGAARRLQEGDGVWSGWQGCVSNFHELVNPTVTMPIWFSRPSSANSPQWSVFSPRPFQQIPCAPGRGFRRPHSAAPCRCTESRSFPHLTYFWMKRTT